MNYNNIDNHFSFQYQTFNILKEDFDKYKSKDGSLKFLYKITHKETGLVYIGRKTAHTLKNAIQYKGSSCHILFKNIKDEEINLFSWEIISYHPEGITLRTEENQLIDHESELILKTKKEFGDKCVNQHSNNGWFFTQTYIRTDEHKKYMSIRIKESISKGIKKSWNKGKNLSDEDKLKKKISANKVEVKEKQKRNRIGRKWFNNGIEEMWIKEEEFKLLPDKEKWLKGRIPLSKEIKRNKFKLNKYICPYCFNYVSSGNHIKYHINKQHSTNTQWEEFEKKDKYLYRAINYLELEIVKKYFEEKDKY